ncbi:unnamed protein product [Phytophthora lilii]|uniref:Pectinesterase n=1 Tax=Phytophthora lilii TaxID=2077276 RepID=A0A9W6X131_9STRA|nr:unnamed protein product [Phytophthora lilii]
MTSRHYANAVRVRNMQLKVYNLNVANPEGKIKQLGQAVAVYVDNTDYGFYGCNFTGYQDTLCANKGKELYARSYISGAVDFIFGQQSKAWFESCDFESVGNGSITANGNSNSSNLSEYVFNNAHVFGVNKSSAYLGRPWYPYARVVWQNSDLGDVINPQGWQQWNKDNNTANVYFKEFNNSGPGAATGQRVSFSGQLTAPAVITDILGKDYESNGGSTRSTCESLLTATKDVHPDIRLIPFCILPLSNSMSCSNDCNLSD